MSKPSAVAKDHAPKEAPPKLSVATFDRLVADVTITVDEWAAAWSAHDVQRYLAAYAKDFTPELGTRAEWEKQRRERVGKAGKLKIAVSELQVSSFSPDRATATFVQSYESPSYSDKTRKTLELRNVGGRWLIVREYTRS